MEGHALQAEMLKVFRKVPRQAGSGGNAQIPEDTKGGDTNSKPPVKKNHEPNSKISESTNNNSSDGDDVLRELCDLLVPSYQEGSSKQLSRYGKGKGPYDKECYVYKEPADGEPSSYLHSGMALTDYYCDIFFDRIAQRSAKRQFARGSVNDVGTAVSAVLGLASAGSAVTGGIGAGFGLIDSGIQNYDQAFLVDADLPALQKLVRSEQDRIRNAIFDGDKTNGTEPKTFQQAAIQIMRYANTCSFTGMRGLLTQTMIESANAAKNPLDGSRILDFSTLTPAQQEAMVEALGAQKKLNDANREAAKAQREAPNSDEEASEDES